MEPTQPPQGGKGDPLDLPDNRPSHIAIIMDGRWAKQRYRPRTFGHQAGARTVRLAVEFCLRASIQSLTLFAFSSENWRRPPSEVSALMQLFLRALDREVRKLVRHGVRLTFIGDTSAFAPELQARMRDAAESTRGNTALRLNVAVNYGGRWDMLQAARRLAQDAASGALDPEQVGERDFARYLALADQPEPDLFIRTGGDHRISNFLLWQLAYTELYFTDVLWPDVDMQLLSSAVHDFARRERRFGQTGEQVSQGRGHV